MNEDEREKLIEKRKFNTGKQPLLPYLTNNELIELLSSFEWHYNVFDGETFEQEMYPGTESHDRGIALLSSGIIRILDILCNEKDCYNKYGSYDILTSEAMSDIRKILGYSIEENID